MVHVSPSHQGCCTCTAALVLLMVAGAAAQAPSDAFLLPPDKWNNKDDEKLARPYLLGPFTPGANDRYSGPQEGPNSKEMPSKYELVEVVNARRADQMVAVHLTHIPGTDKYLHLSRPDCGRISGVFDMVNRTWSSVESKDSVFCSGHAVTATGQVIIAGGHEAKSGYADGMHSIRTYDVRQDATKLVQVAKLIRARWYPSVTLLPDGKVLVMGGTIKPNKFSLSDGNPDYEVFDPADPAAGTKQFPVEKAYLEAYPANYYPFNFVLPTGDVFNFCKRISRIIVAQKGHYRRDPETDKFVGAPNKPKPCSSQYPQSGSAVMLALRPPYDTAEVVVFGGANNSKCDPNKVADKRSYRMSMRWTYASDSSPPSYTFSNWTVEGMGIPRVMPDATLLPNGKVIVQNGAQSGCAGDQAIFGSMKCKYPAFWAELYDPDKPGGQRYTILSASTIPRLYHSTAALTTNGTILVAGCDKAGDGVPGEGAVVTDITWRSYPPRKDCESRQELFHPPYTLDASKQPVITSVNGVMDRRRIIQMAYNETLTLTWNTKAGTVDVSDATLVAPSSTTHSFNTNQRVVFLRKAGTFSSNSGRIIPGTGSSSSGGPSRSSITFRTPPHPYIAPPQMYMLFALNGDYYGQSWWVQLVDKTGAGKKLRPMHIHAGDHSLANGAIA